MSAAASASLDRAAINCANGCGRDADSLSTPRTDPYVRNSRMRLLSRMSNVEVSIRVRVQYAWSRKPAIKERADAVPKPAAGRGVPDRISARTGSEDSRGRPCPQQGDLRGDWREHAGATKKSWACGWARRKEPSSGCR